MENAPPLADDSHRRRAVDGTAALKPIETARLIIRGWEPRDRRPYATFLADAEVRKFFRSVVDGVTAGLWVDSYIESLKTTGFGWRAIERKSDGAFIGDAGVDLIDEPSRAVIRGRPLAEAGWLIGRSYWGQGYGTEAACACLRLAWAGLGLTEVVAAAHAENLASHRVMAKVGMTRDPAGDFLDPRFLEEHWLGPHVLYRASHPDLG